jgi:hypothetical protein
MTRKSDAENVVDFGDMTIVPVQNGPFAFLEYPHALPRAKLYSHWQSMSDDNETLKTLASEEFDPETAVLVSKETSVPASSDSTGNEPGTVTITDYQPKTVKLTADAKMAAVLLLNDRTAADWSVFVDGQKSSLLRCNYIMRGVFLNPGQHTVEFRYRPSLKPLYVSLATIILGLAMVGFVVVRPRNGTKIILGDPAVALNRAASKVEVTSSKNSSLNKRVI